MEAIIKQLPIGLQRALWRTILIFLTCLWLLVPQKAVADSLVLTTSGITANYIQTQAAVIIDSGLTLSGSDMISEATVAITNNFVSSEDQLEFSNRDGISGSYDAEKGILTLSGSGDAVAYQAALRMVAYRNTNEGSAMSNTTRTITFSVGGIDGIQNVRIIKPSPLYSRIAINPESVTADDTSTATITIQLQDTSGVNLTTSGGTVLLSSSRGETADTISSVLDNGDGTYTATIKSKLAGSAVVSGVINGQIISDTKIVTFVPGAASAVNSTISISANSITADGSSSAVATVQLIDACGNNLTTISTDDVVITCTGGTVGDTSYIGNGQYQATIKSSTIAGGPYTAGATLGGSAINAITSISFVPGPATTDNSTISIDNSSIVADGESSTLATVQLKDANGNNLTSGDDMVVISCTGGMAGETSYAGGGKYQAIITASTIAGGPYTIITTLNGEPLTQTSTVVFIPGPAAGNTSTIITDLTSIPVGGITTTVTVRLKDKCGNDLTAGGDHVVITATSGTVSPVHDNGDGTYNANLISSTVAGAVTVNASVNNNTFTDTANITYTPGGASTNTSTITADSSSITADGTSTALVTVQLKDSYGNILSGSGGVTVTLNATGGSLSPVIDNQDGTYSASLTSTTTAGTVTISGKLNGISISDIEEVTLSPGTAATGSSTISSSVASLVAGESTTAKITIKLKDAYGNQLGSSGGEVVLSTTAGSLSIVTDNGDGTYTAFLTAATMAGTAIIRGTLNGEPIAATATVEFIAGAAVDSTSTITPSTAEIVVGGNNLTVKVQLKDQYGNNLTTSGGVITLSSTLGTLSSVTDLGNGSYTATLTSGTIAGTTTISGQLDGTPLGNTATVTFKPGAAVKGASTITAGAASIIADGDSTSLITVQLKDMYGNDLNTGGATVTLNTSRGALSTVTDNNNGTYTAILYSAKTTGITTISGQLNGAAITDTETVTFIPGPAVASRSVISAAVSSLMVGESSTSEITVQLKDQFDNNLTTSGGGTLILSAISGTVTSVGDQGNGTYKAVFTADTITGTAIISGQYNGSTIGVNAIITLLPGEASLNTSTISAGHSAISDGGASTKITVQLKDKYGNDLAGSGGIVALYTTAGTISPVIDNGDGTYLATLTSSTLVDSAVVSGTLAGRPLTSTITVDYSIGVASAVTSIITTAATSIIADDSNSTTITVRLKDIYGNNLTSGGDTVSLTATSGTISEFTDHNNGTYTATLTAATTTGTVTISGKVNGVQMAHSATVNFIPGQATASTSTITATAAAIQVGGHTTTITVQLQDQYGNPLIQSGGDITLETSAGTLSPVTDNKDGTYSAVLTSSNTAGAATISCKLADNSVINDTETVTYTPGAADADNSVIIASPSSIRVGGKNSTVTVQLKDQYGNKLIAGGDTVKLTTSGGYLSHVTDQDDGTYTATLTSLTVSGEVTVSGAVNNQIISNTAFVTFIAEDPAAAASTVNAADFAITADGASTTTITVQLKDQYGNDLTFSSGAVTMVTTAGTLSTVSDNHNGTYTATLTSSTRLETATIYARLNGSLISQSVTVKFVIGAASATTSLVTASPVWIPADGSSKSTINVQLRDAQGHFLINSGGVVTLNANIGTLSSVTDNNNGTYTATITSNTSGGTATINAFIDGNEITNYATVGFSTGGGESTPLTLKASPTSITADGLSTSTITVQYGTINNADVHLSTTAGILGPVTNNHDGTYTAVLTASRVVETAYIGLRIGSFVYGNMTSVSFVAGPASPATSWISTGASSIIADGASTTTITVRLRDAYGNYLTSGGAPVGLTLTPSHGTIGAITDNGDGTYSATLTSSTIAGTVVISGTISGTAIVNTASVYLAPGTVSPATSTITASPSSIQAGGANASVIVQLKDAFGNNLISSAGQVTLSVSDGSLSTVIDNKDGTYVSTLTSASAVEIVTISGKIGVSDIADTETVRYTVGPASINTSTITAGSSSITADGVSATTITVKLKDAYGNDLTSSGATVALTATNGSLSGITDREDGTYTATLTAPSTVGTAEISGTLNGANIATIVSVSFVPGAASITTSTIEISPASITVGGQTGLITVKLKDDYNNDLTTGGDTVNFAASSGTIGPVTDLGNGIYSATLTSSTIAGTVTVTGFINTKKMNDTATVKFLPGPADMDISTITAADSSLTVGGSHTIITVQLKDQYGNNLISSGGTVALNCTAGSLSGVTDKGDGTYVATLTSPTQVGPATIAGKLDETDFLDTETVNFEIGAASARTSTITVSPVSIIADGTSTAAITIQLADQFGNLLTTSGGVTLTLSSTKGNIGTITDDKNGAYSAILTSSTVAGAVTISGILNGTSMTNMATITFEPGPASAAKAVITAGTLAITADGTSKSTITVQLKDQYGNNLKAGGGTVTLSTTAGSIGGVTDNLNGTYTAILTSATVTGTAKITGELDRADITDSEMVTFIPGAAVAIATSISAIPASIAVGGANSTIIVQLKDLYGNNLNSSGGAVSLATTAGSITDAIAQGDGTYIATLTSSTLTETATISGTLDEATITDTATVTFTAGTVSAATSVITASPTTLTADGESQSALTVQLKDRYGNNLTSSLGITLTLNATSGTISNLVNHNDGTFGAVLTVPTTAGTGIISGKIDGLSIINTVTMHYIPGPAAAAISTISASPATITANGLSTSTITVKLKDQYGNNLTTSSAMVELTSTIGTISNLTDNANGTWTAALTSTTVAGTAIIKGTLDTVKMANEATVQFTPGAAAAGMSVISASPSTIIADGVSKTTITVQLKDAYGNNLSTSGGTVTLSATTGTLSMVKDNNNGMYTATLTATTRAGNAVVSGKLNGSAITSTATIIFSAGAASKATSTMSASPSSATADGVAAVTITVRLKDAYSNFLTVSGGTVALNTSRGALSVVTDNHDGSYTATLTSSTSGTAMITGTVNTQEMSARTTVTFLPGPATAEQSVLTASSSSIIANGSSTSTITVQLKDQYGNNLTSSGGTVTLATNNGSLSNVTDNNNGTYTAVLTSGTAVGMATITGAINTKTITDNEMVSFIPGPADKNNSIINVSPDTVTADGSSKITITVQLIDANNNNLTSSGGTVTLVSTRGTVGVVIDNNNGTYTASLTSTSAGSGLVTGTIAGQTMSDSKTVNFLPGPAVAAQSTITASSSEIIANGSSTSIITVQLRDRFGNNLTGSDGTVALINTYGAMGNVTDNKNGTYTAALTSATTAGTTTITGTLNDQPITDNEVVHFIPGPADETKSTISVSPDTVTADGVTTVTVTVQLIDAFNNNLISSGGIVTVTSTQGTVGSVTDNNNGTYTAGLTSTSAGTGTVTGTVAGKTISDSKPVTFLPGPADKTQSTITANPAGIEADGLSTTTITVQLKDKFGNNLTVSADQVGLTTNRGTLSGVTNNNDGTFSATLTSSTVAGAVTVSGTLNTQAMSKTAIVTFLPGPPDVTLSMITAGSNQIVANGSSATTITVQLKDKYGNNLISSGGAVALATTYGSLSSVTDKNNGTYTAILTSAPTVGTATITGALNTTAITDNEVVNMVPGPADTGKSTITVSPDSATADGIAAITINVRLIDANNNNLTSSGGTVTLSSNRGIISTVKDNNDGTYTATITSTSAGGATISGKIGTQAMNAAANVTFLPGPLVLANSTITAGPTGIIANGASTSTITVQLKDQYGNNELSSAGTVQLFSSNGLLSGVTDNHNGSYTAILTSTTIVGTATITGTLDGEAFTDSEIVHFIPGPADETKSTISVDPDTVTADGAAVVTVTVRLIDAFNNNLISSGGTVTLNSTRGTIGVVTDNNNGAYTASLTSTSAGTGVVTGTVAGKTISDSKAVTFLPGPADKTQSTITASPDRIVADGISNTTVTVQLKDKFGNNLTASSDTLELTASDGTLSGVSNNNDGTFTATLKSSTRSGTVTVSGILNNMAMSKTANVAFLPGAADVTQSTITASSNSIIANGSSTAVITVQLKDKYGNDLIGSGGTVVLDTNYGLLTGVTDKKDGTYTATLTSEITAGTATITGTLDSQAMNDNEIVSFIPGAADITKSTLSVSPDTVTADGVKEITVTVKLIDAYGNSLTGSGGTVALNSTRGTVDAVQNNNNGTYSASLTSTSAGTGNVTAKLENALLSDAKTVTFLPGAADVTQSTITASSNSIIANGSSTAVITVQLKDKYGNDLIGSGGTVVLDTNYGLLTGVTDKKDGTYTATLTSEITAGTATITGTLDSQAMNDNEIVSFIPGAADITKSTLSVSPDTVTADGVKEITVTVKLIDAYGNSLTGSGGTVALNSTRGTVDAVQNNNNGTYSASLTSTSAGTGNVTAKLENVLLSDAKTVTFLPGVADVAKSVISVSPGSIIADGNSTATVTVQLSDQYGNDLISNGGAVDIHCSGGIVTNHGYTGNGQYRATVTSSTVVGTYSISASLNGLPITATTSIYFAPGHADAGTSSINVSPDSIVADGGSSAVVTVQLKDINGNNLTTNGGTVKINCNGGTTGDTSYTANGQYQATIISSTTAGTYDISATLDGTALTAAASINFVAGIAAPERSTIRVDKSSIIANGSSTAIVTVQLKDADGNDLITDGGNVVVQCPAGTVGITSYKDNGQYQAVITSATLAGGPYTISATLDGIALSATSSISFVAGAATTAQSSISVDKSSIIADGSSTATVTVQLRDANGNNLTSGGGIVVIQCPAGAVSATGYTGNGKYQATITSATAAGGPYTIRATLDATPITATADISFIAGAVTNGRSAIKVDKNSIIADGASTATVTVQLKDINGNNLTTDCGKPVIIYCAGGIVGPTYYTNNGQYQATITSATTAGGPYDISATLDGTPITATTTISFIAGNATNGQSTISVDKTSIIADGASAATVTVQLKDINGNNLVADCGKPVIVYCTGGTVGATSFAGNGRYQATIISATSVGGPYTISASLDGTSLTATTSISFVPGAASTGQSTISVDKSSIIADGDSTATVTVQLKDAYGNTLTSDGGTVVIKSAGGTVGTTRYTSAGQYQTTITSSTKAGGPYTISATLNGTALTAVTNIIFEAGVAAAERSTISVDKSSIVANGKSTAIATVQLKDINGNNLTSDVGTVVISCLGASIGATNYTGNGRYQATITSLATVGTYIIGATLDGSEMAAKTSINFVYGAVKITYQIIGNLLKVQVDNLAYDHTELIIDGATPVIDDADMNGITTFNLPQEAGVYTLRIRVYYNLSGSDNYYSDPVVVIYRVRPRYVPGKGDGFGWEMWK
jgi:adhesin/invasin